MTLAVRFRTSMFDISAERTNPINPIPGESLLHWLAAHAPAPLQVNSPEAEDWGWFSMAHWHGSTYLFGSCATEVDHGEHEWVLQIVKQRSLMEKLLGRGRMASDDECALCVLGVLHAETAFKEISTDAES